MKAWLCSSILSWVPRQDGGTYLDFSLAQRSYEYLRRAEQFLQNESSDFDRADCISNLRKCLSHRLKHFEAIYNLRSTLETAKKRHYLEILADLGIVRPSLIKGLLEIRNKIEYNDVVPPETARCLDLCDIVWYFLRSTDSLLHLERTSVMLTPPDSDPWDSVYWCSLDLEYMPTFEVKLRGWFSAHLASTTEQESHLPIITEVYHTKLEKMGIWV